MVDLLECYWACARAIKSLAETPHIELVRGSQHAEHTAAQSRFEARVARARSDADSEINRIRGAGSEEKRKIDNSALVGYKSLFGFVFKSDGTFGWGRALFAFLAAWVLLAMLGLSGFLSFNLALLAPLSSLFVALYFGSIIEDSKSQVDAASDREVVRIANNRDSEIAKCKIDCEKERQKIDASFNQRLARLDKLVDQEDAQLAVQAQKSQKDLQGWTMYFSGVVAEVVKKGGTPEPPGLLRLGELSIHIPS